MQTPTHTGSRVPYYRVVAKSALTRLRTGTNHLVSAMLFVLMLLVGGMAVPLRVWGQYRAPDQLATMRVALPVKFAGGALAGNRGFTLTAEFSHLFSAGYAGVTLELRSNAGAAAATRQLMLQLTPIERHVPAEQAVAVRIPMEFPQGSSQIQLRRVFPKWTLGDSFRVEVYEDGVLLPGYVTEVGSPLPSYALQSPVSVMPNETQNDVLVIDADVNRLPQPPLRAFASSRTLTSWHKQTWQQLPLDWRLLRDIDCVVVSHRRLREHGAAIADTQQQAAKALTPDQQRFLSLRDWLLMGGVLVVTDAPPPADLQSSLGVTVDVSDQERQTFQNEIATVVAEANQLIASMKQFLDESVVSSTVVNGVSEFGPVQLAPPPMPPGGGFSSTLSAAELRDASEWIKRFSASIETFRSDWSESYRTAAGGGIVIGLAADALVVPHAANALYRSAGFRTSALLTRGVEPLMGDSRSRRWLIPGVAKPPVYSFIAILTLFVVLVGPVSYRWTTRGHRSHLMFLIAPALALLTTASMFTYSIVADGFGTTARIRQLTWVESASGDAAERTRLTLFCGIGPSEDVPFDAAAELLPYPSGSALTWKTLPVKVENIRSSVTVDEQTQRFSPSILPSRTQTQFVSHRIRRRLGYVGVTGMRPFDAANPEAATADVIVENGLPFELRELIARTRDGRYWSAERIASGETAVGDWIPTMQQTSKQLGDLYNRFRMISTDGGQRRRRGPQIHDVMLYMNRQVDSSKALTDGVFEEWLNAHMFVRGELPPGTFVAISTPSPDALAIEDAALLESVRFVIGTLR